MLAGNWPNPPHESEYAVRFDQAREKRLLVIPALFDEGNKLRHFTVQVMRRLDDAGIDCLLPDLPGTNESLAKLPAQSLASWRFAMSNAASDFGATHQLSLRAGHLCMQDNLPHLAFAPVQGSSILRTLLRARVLADREAGFEVTEKILLESGKHKGLRLAGYDLGPEMVCGLAEDRDHPAALNAISQNDIGGTSLWLRAEPEHDPVQAVSLADKVKDWLA